MAAETVLRTARRWGCVEASTTTATLNRVIAPPGLLLRVTVWPTPFCTAEALYPGAVTLEAANGTDPLALYVFDKLFVASV